MKYLQKIYIERRSLYEKTIIYTLLQYFPYIFRNRSCDSSVTRLFKRFGIKGSDLGLLVAAFALSQMIISPFGGTLADKLGKKLIICIGLVLFSISEFMFAAGQTFTILIISRVLGDLVQEW